jgi:ribosomal subunit interface protein
MAIRIAGKNFDIGQALRTRIDETVSSTVGKYFDRGFSGQVTVSKSGPMFETDLALHLDSGVVLEVQGLNADAYLSFDQAAERLAKRLRRYKRRLADH